MTSEVVSPERSSNAFRSGNERLYEAYNDLHSLAQDFEKPFDAPAILVIGHQTDGKSGALLFSLVLGPDCYFPARKRLSAEPNVYNKMSCWSG